MQTTILSSFESILFAPSIYVTKNSAPIQLRYLTGGHLQKNEVQTSILYSIESLSFALSVNSTKNTAPTFLRTLPGDIEKIVCKSETNNKILLNEPNFVVRSLFFQKATPGTHEIVCKNFFKKGLGFFFEKLKSYIIFYRMNPILSFAPPFFNRLPPGHTK